MSIPQPGSMVTPPGSINKMTAYDTYPSQASAHRHTDRVQALAVPAVHSSNLGAVSRPSGVLSIAAAAIAAAPSSVLPLEKYEKLRDRVSSSSSSSSSSLSWSSFSESAHNPGAKLDRMQWGTSSSSSSRSQLSNRITSQESPPLPTLPPGQAPAYEALINFQRAKSKDAIRCVMCGKTPSDGDSGTVIPQQNKDVCRDCDLALWVHGETRTYFKWCKGCKRFRNIVAFSEKLDATKCNGCRERGRLGYLQRKRRFAEEENSKGHARRRACEGEQVLQIEASAEQQQNEQDNANQSKDLGVYSPNARRERVRRFLEKKEVQAGSSDVTCSSSIGSCSRSIDRDRGVGAQRESFRVHEYVTLGKRPGKLSSNRSKGEADSGEDEVSHSSRHLRRVEQATLPHRQQRWLRWQRRVNTTSPSRESSGDYGQRIRVGEGFQAVLPLYKSSPSSSLSAESTEDEYGGILIEGPFMPLPAMGSSSIESSSMVAGSTMAKCGDDDGDVFIPNLSESSASSTCRRGRKLGGKKGNDIKLELMPLAFEVQDGEGRRQRALKMNIDQQCAGVFLELSHDEVEDDGSPSTNSPPLQSSLSEDNVAAASAHPASLPMETDHCSSYRGFNAKEKARFAAEVVAHRKDLRKVGQALGRSTGDCVLYYYVHFKKGCGAEYEHLKRTMHDGNMEEEYSNDAFENDDAKHDHGKRDEEPLPSIVGVVAQHPLDFGSRVLMRFDNGKWYGGQVVGGSGLQEHKTTPVEVRIAYNDMEIIVEDSKNPLVAAWASSSSSFAPLHVSIALAEKQIDIHGDDEYR